MYVGKQFKANPLWQWTKITKSLHCSNLEICWFWLKIHENCRDCQFSTFMGTLLLPLNSIYNNAPGPRPPKFFNKMHEIWRFILHLYLWNWYGLCEKIHFQKAPISAPCRFWGVPDPLNRNAPGRLLQKKFTTNARYLKVYFASLSLKVATFTWFIHVTNLEICSF